MFIVALLTSCGLSTCRREGRAVHPISWYDLYRTGGPEALGDRSPRPDRVWNRIPDMVRERIIKLALVELAPGLNKPISERLGVLKALRDRAMKLASVTSMSGSNDA